MSLGFEVLFLINTNLGKVLFRIKEFEFINSYNSHQIKSI